MPAIGVTIMAARAKEVSTRPISEAETPRSVMISGMAGMMEVKPITDISVTKRIMRKLRSRIGLRYG